MNCWEFTLILRDVAEVTDVLANALYDSGCDDATVGSSSGLVRVSFSREAAWLQEALQSAVRDVRRAGCEIARVEIEYNYFANTAIAASHLQCWLHNAPVGLAQSHPVPVWRKWS